MIYIKNNLYFIKSRVIFVSMNELDKNLVFIDLSEVNSENDYTVITEMVYGNDPIMSDFLKTAKENLGCVKIYIWCPSMEIVFFDLNPSKSHEFSVLDKCMSEDLMSMKHNSTTKQEFEFKHNLIMVEPSRIKSQSDLIGDLKHLKISDIDLLKKKNVSKVWFWKSTMEIIAFKTKGIQNLNFDGIESRKDKFESVSITSSLKNTEEYKSIPEIKLTKKSVFLDTDTILDKISDFGIESLTKEEKNYLDSL